MSTETTPALSIEETSSKKTPVAKVAVSKVLAEEAVDGRNSLIPEEQLGQPQQPQQKKPTFYPALREDIDLYPAAPLADGAPSWVLHDLVSNRFVQIGWQEFEILNRWPLKNVMGIVQSVNKETALTIEPDDVIMTGQFLQSQQFLKPPSIESLQKQVKAMRAKKGGTLKFLLHHYLFFRLPVFHPDEFLANTLWIVKPTFSKIFRFSVLLVGLLGIFLVMRQWDVFVRSSLQLLSWDSLIYYFIAVFFAKICHELGHAYTCKYYGLNVPVIGIAFLVLCPFLYTDTGESWKLTSRLKRLNIVIGGMGAEFTLAAFSTFAWSVFSPGPLRNTAFFLATTSWIMTLIVNLSPFMRWDGYYLLSDLTGIKNLQPRAMALAKWYLRERLFGFGHPPPEENTPKTQSFMIIYAYCTWIYRLSVFAGITVLVYHFFIKPVAIFLALVELAWFIWLPIQKELKVWYDMRDEMYWNRHSIVTVSILAGLLLLFFLPWKNYTMLPAVIRPAQFTDFYPPVVSRVDKVFHNKNETVKKGEPIFALSSPDLEYELSQAQLEIRLGEALMHRSISDELREQREVAIEQNLKALKQREGLLRQKDQLIMKAPHDGVIMSIPDAVKPGLWLGEEDYLGMLAADGAYVVYAYAKASDLELLPDDTEGIFYVDNNDFSPVPVRLTQNSGVGSAFLADPLFASTNGGPIEIRDHEDGRYIPKESVYLTLFQVKDSNRTFSAMRRGYVRVKIKPRSFAREVWRNLYSLLIRESGF